MVASVSVTHCCVRVGDPPFRAQRGRRVAALHDRREAVRPAGGHDCLTVITERERGEAIVRPDAYERFTVIMGVRSS